MAGGAAAAGGLAATGSVVTGEWLRDELTRLREQVLRSEATLLAAAARLDGEAAPRLWSARATAWDGDAAEAFRGRCLRLELDAGSAAERARLAYAALADARAAIEAELGELGT